MVFLVTGVTGRVGSWCGEMMVGGGVGGRGEGRKGMGMTELWTVEGGKRRRLMWEGRALDGEGGREDREVPCFLSM